MGYENVDEVARRQACERVKQIVRAIKTMKIKYYVDFTKISVKDKETYQKLEESLERISSSHNLSNLKVALMSEVSARYDRGSSGESGDRNFQNPDDILQACYGVIDAHKEALSRGKIVQARKCQKILEQYKGQISSPEILEEILNYQRRKFGELAQLREQMELGNSRTEVENQMEQKNEECKAKISRMCKTKRQHVQGRDKIKEIVSSLLKESEQQKPTVLLGGRI